MYSQLKNICTITMVKKTPQKCGKKWKEKPERSLHALPRRKRNHIYCIYNTLTCTGDTGSTYTGTLSITSCKSLGSPVDGTWSFKKQIADVSIKKNYETFSTGCRKPVHHEIFYSIIKPVMAFKKKCRLKCSWLLGFQE